MSTPFASCLLTAPCIALLAAGHLLLAALLAQLMLGHGLKAPRTCMAGMAAAFAVLFADVAAMASGYLALFLKEDATGFASWCLTWPVGVHAGAVFAAAVLALGGAHFLHRWRASHITPGTAKEALDKLPRGLCFADAGGTPLLVNAQMEQLAFAVSGKAATDARLLWENVRALDGSASEWENAADAASAAGEPGAQEATVVLDGTAWLFARRAIRLKDGTQCWQISADDVTVEHELGRELAQRNERLQQMGRRLREFSHDAQRVIREQEIVQARAMVHDETGRVLLATAHYLEHPDAGDAQAVLAQWQAMADLLLLGTPDADSGESDMQAALEEVAQAAASIGVAVRIAGEVPATEPASGLVLRALGEAVVNARRHGGARELEMRVFPGDTSGYLRVEFANGGAPPAAPIRETGGLATLRRQVEHAGGIMLVQHVPTFKLVLELPR